MNQTLHDIITHLYANAPAFTARLDAAGLTTDDLKTAVSLSALPVFRKDDLIELQKKNPPFGGLLAMPIGDLRRVYQSPGPINEPEPHIEDAGN